VQPRPAVRLAYNSAVYALAGGAGGAAATLTSDHAGTGGLLLEVLLAAAAFYGVNVLLTAGVIARWSEEPFLPFLEHSVRSTVVPF
jgi:hypothetical protein